MIRDFSARAAALSLVGYRPFVLAGRRPFGLRRFGSVEFTALMAVHVRIVVVPNGKVRDGTADETISFCVLCVLVVLVSSTHCLALSLPAWGECYGITASLDIASSCRA